MYVCMYVTDDLTVAHTVGHVPHRHLFHCVFIFANLHLFANSQNLRAAKFCSHNFMVLIIIEY